MNLNLVSNDELWNIMFGVNCPDEFIPELKSVIKEISIEFSLLSIPIKPIFYAYLVFENRSIWKHTRVYGRLTF